MRRRINFIYLLIILLFSCSIIRYQNSNRKFNVFIININIDVNDIENIIEKDELGILDPIEDSNGFNDCIKLSHCSILREIERKGNLVKVIGGKSIKNILDNNPACNSILILKYRGYGNFSNGGDDVKTYFLKNNEIVEITKSFDTNEKLYYFDYNGKSKFKLLNIEKVKANLKTEYKIKMNKSDSINIIETHKVQTYPNVELVYDYKSQLCI